MLWRGGPWLLATRLVLLSLASPADDAVTGAVAAATEGIRQRRAEAEDDMAIGFTCDSSQPCCGAHIAMARLAVMHVNTRNSNYSAELATELPENMPKLELVEILFNESTDIFRTAVDFYRLQNGTGLPAAVVGVLRNLQVEELSQLAQRFSIPVFSVAKAGVLGLQSSTATEYSNVYRMVAPSYQMARVVVSIMTEFKFWAAAVIYDPLEEEEVRIRDELFKSSGADLSFIAFPILTETGGANLTTVVDNTLMTLDLSGVKTFVVLLQDTNKFKLVMERAHRIGLCGNNKDAIGTAWIAATGFVPWEVAGTYHQEEYVGMLAIEEKVYDTQKMRLMAQEWREVMPRGCGGLSPSSKSVKFSTIMRNHMPYLTCEGLANTYDSVIALALAQAALTNQANQRQLRDKASLDWGARWLATVEDTVVPAPREDDSDAVCKDEVSELFGTTSVEYSLKLSAMLKKGVRFGGLSGEVDRSGSPWRVKEGVWHVVNKRSKESSQTVMSWTDSGGLQWPVQEGRRLLVVPGLVWPGGISSEDTGTGAPITSNLTTCFGIDCKNFGSCQTRPAIAREGGWCKCSVQFYGRRCEHFYEPFRLVDHPGMDAREPKPTMVTVLPYVDRFHSIDSEEGHFKVTLHTLFMWDDSRVPSTLDNGTYTTIQANALVNEGLLWLPRMKLRRQSSVVELGGYLYIRGGKMALLAIAEYEVSSDLDWSSFPFDVQDLNLFLTPGGDYESNFVLGTCTMSSDLPESVVDVCNSMAHDGVPDASLGRWSSLWQFLSSKTSEESTGILLRIKVQRDASTFIMRIFVPSIFLVVVSWAGFFVNPKTVMPRFASAFISFLALQTFKTNAQKLTPADAATITWTDVYMSAVGILMVFAVIENMFVPYANEHWAERSALFIDCYSRFSFPAVFIVVIAVMLAIREPFPFLNTFVHLWLVGFTLVSFCVALWEYRTFQHTIIQRELRRVRNAVKKQANVKLTLEPVEMKSIFSAIDSDGSGIVEAEEIFPYVSKMIHENSEANTSTMQQKLKDDLGPAFHQGVALGEFDPLLTKVMYMMVDQDYKHEHRKHHEVARKHSHPASEIDEDN